MGEKNTGTPRGKSKVEVGYGSWEVDQKEKKNKSLKDSRWNK